MIKVTRVLTQNDPVSDNGEIVNTVKLPTITDMNKEYLYLGVVEKTVIQSIARFKELYGFSPSEYFPGTGIVFVGPIEATR
jgi:hypothetical protein